MSTPENYAGKNAYHGDVVTNYERDRETEDIWPVEQQWMERWIKTLPPRARVLDLPVGTGRFVEAMLSHGLRVHGSDISADMLRSTEKRGGGSPDLTLSQSDVEALPFAADAFDAVVCWRLFHLLPPAVAGRALSELARVCKGTLVLQVFGVTADPFWRVILRKLKKRVVRKSESKRDVSPQTPWSHIESYPYTDRLLSRLFRESGMHVSKSCRLGSYGGAGVWVYLLSK